MSKAIILMYHNIAVPPKDAAIPNLYVTPKMFRFQMWCLKAAGFRVASIEELCASVAEGRLECNTAAITFDDGFADFYENAYPVFRRHRYPSTVYVVSGRADNAWDAQLEPVRKPLMSMAQLAEVSRNGVCIGSHTKTHPHLASLSPEALVEEVAGSKKELEGRLNLPIDHFCYPYGEYDERVKETVMRAGYRYAVSTLRGHITSGCDPFALRRIPIKLIATPVSFMYKVLTNSEKRKGKQV
jgi:peptidoglycan/xylan/chitin deacetylase (PgdA/CDA1 family)